MGYGYSDPSASHSELNMISFIVRQMIAKMSTMKLVKVTAVTGGGIAPAGTVDVQPLVSQVDGNGYGTDHGIVPGIPWSRAQGGKAALICDPVVGDIGYVIASDRDISKVKSTFAAALPGSGRTFDIADGIYVGGCLAQEAPTTYLQLTSDGGFELTDKFGNKVTSTADGIVVTLAAGKPFKINGDAAVTGNLLLTGTLKAADGTTYAGDIQTTGALKGGTVVANPGGSQVTLAGHIHSANNTPPTPGH